MDELQAQAFGTSVVHLLGEAAAVVAHREGDLVVVASDFDGEVASLAARKSMLQRIRNQLIDDQAARNGHADLQENILSARLEGDRLGPVGARQLALANAIQPAGTFAQGRSRHTQGVVVKAALLLPDVKGRLAPVGKCEREI